MSNNSQCQFIRVMDDLPVLKLRTKTKDKGSSCECRRFTNEQGTMCRM